MPELITETLLVVEGFKDRGTEYWPGDRVPVHHRAIRRIAAEHPAWFAMEYAPEDLDMEWLAALELEAEKKYEAQKRLVEETKARRKRAIRHELDSQDSQDLPQQKLEKRFRKQEEEEEERKKQAREDREREAVESNVFIGERYSGLNF